MRKDYKILGLIFSALILVSAVGCGKQNIEDVEYDLGGSGEKTESSLDQNQSEQILAERIGIDDNIVVKDEISVGNVKVSFDIDEEPQEIYRIPSYKADTVKYDAEKEEKIVKNLFGDTAQKIEVNEDDYLGSEDEEGSTRSENDVFHVYEGEYEGNTYRLVYAYLDYSHSIDISLRPIDVGAFIGNPNIKYIHHFYRDQDIFAVSSETEQRMFGNTLGNEEDEEISEEPDGSLSMYNLQAFFDEMSDMPNKYDASDDQLYGIASDMIKNKMGLHVLEETICVEPFYGNNNGEGEDESDKPQREELFFSDSKEFGNSIDNTDNLIKDGYAVNIESVIGDMSSTINGLGTDDNYGWINITSKGVAGFEYHYGYVMGEMLSEDVHILKFDDVVECLKNSISEYLNPNDLSGNNLLYYECNLGYYGVRSPDKAGEYTFIPAWFFYGTDNKEKSSEIVLNAVDGSYIMMRNE